MSQTTTVRCYLFKLTCFGPCFGPLSGYKGIYLRKLDGMSHKIYKTKIQRCLIVV